MVGLCVCVLGGVCWPVRSSTTFSCCFSRVYRCCLETRYGIALITCIVIDHVLHLHLLTRIESNMTSPIVRVVVRCDERMSTTARQSQRHQNNGWSRPELLYMYCDALATSVLQNRVRKIYICSFLKLNAGFELLQEQSCRRRIDI